MNAKNTSQLYHPLQCHLVAEFFAAMQICAGHPATHPQHGVGTRHGCDAAVVARSVCSSSRGVQSAGSALPKLLGVQKVFAISHRYITIDHECGSSEAPTKGNYMMLLRAMSVAMLCVPCPTSRRPTKCFLHWTRCFGLCLSRAVSGSFWTSLIRLEARRSPRPRSHAESQRSTGAATVILFRNRCFEMRSELRAVGIELTQLSQSLLLASRTHATLCFDVQTSFITCPTRTANTCHDAGMPLSIRDRA